MSKVIINGVEIMTVAQNKAMINEQIPLYPKSACDGIAEDNLNDVFEHAVSK